MADYQLLGTGYGMNDGVMEDSGLMGNYGPSASPEESGLLPAAMSGMMPAVQPGQSSYHQMGYQQNQVPHKFSQYAGYSAMGANQQYGNMGSRLHHIPDQVGSAMPTTTAGQQMTSYPSHQTLSNNRYAPRQQFSVAQQNAQYSAQYVQQPQHASATDMWQTQQTPQQTSQQGYLHSSAGFPTQQTTSGVQRGIAKSSAYVPEDTYADQQQQQPVMQRKPTFASQPSPNGPPPPQHMGQNAASQALTHIPVSQTGQAYSSQGPYGTTNSQSTIVRPHYGSASPVSSVQHPAGVMTSSRPMHRLSYTPLGSTQQTPAPARMQQYSYSTNQSYPVQSSLGESSTPPHLSPFSQAAPSSPQYRSAVYPPSMALSPRQPTPPAGSPLPTLSLSRTPDRVVQTQAPATTPQSQGSYPSPSGGGHVTSSPGQQVLSPNAPSSSLQQLEQMVMPSNSVKASQSGGGLCSGMLGNSYFGPQQQQQQTRSPSGAQAIANRSYPHVQPQQQQQYMGPATAQQMMAGSPAYVPNAIQSSQLEDIASSQNVYSATHSSSLQQVVQSHNPQEANLQYQTSASTYQNGLYNMSYQPTYSIQEDKKVIETPELPVVHAVCPPPSETPSYHYNTNQYPPPEPVRTFNEETSDEPVYVELQPATQFHSVLDIVPQTSSYSPEPLTLPPPPVSSIVLPVELSPVVVSESPLPLPLPPEPEPTFLVAEPEVQEEIKPIPKKPKTSKGKKKAKAAKPPPVIEEPLPFVEPMQADSSSNVSLAPLGEPSVVDSTFTEKVIPPRKGGKKRKAEPKASKPKKPKKAKTPKEPKKPKSKKVVEENEDKENVDGKESTSGEQTEKEDQPEKKSAKKKAAPKEGKSRSPPKKKLPKLGLKFSKKKKRKRFGSSENSDIDRTPPPSPKEDDGIQKRRSARNTKRKKYIDDIDMMTDEEELLDVSERLLRSNADGPAVQVLTNVNFDEIMVVDKILAVRTVTKKDETTNEDIEQEEFYIKYKNLSYLHCEWKVQEELEAADKRVIQKLKRFRQKRETISNIFDFLEEDLYNPDYVEVDRILDCTDAIEEVDNSIDGIARETVDAMIRSVVSIVDNSLDMPYDRTRKNKHYLVKWRALAYEDSTWELEDDLDIDKIRHFFRFRTPPPKEKWKPKRRPKPSEWVKLEESPVYKGGNTLREYQLEGLSWLTFCWYHGQNCILADEMGLGKTIQSLTFLDEIVNYGISGPFLVIAPLSTIGNWQREFETWTDINVITYHGSSASRNMIQEYEMYYKTEKNERIKELYKFQVMITTFEIILTDYMELREIPWKCVIIDEAHRLKNRNCKLLEGLRMMETEHRVLLTGTPLQNNVEELFSLLNFLEPTRFMSTEAFMEEFGDLKTESQVDKLKALLKPMMLRRLKEDVEKSLAPKEETIVEVELTNIQKKYYRAILERNFAFLTKGGSSHNMPNLMNTMMELRKCCIHPFLINGAEEQIILEHKTQHGDNEETVLNAMIQASGKLVLIDKLLTRLKANGHRVLIFSQMVRCLDILEDFLVHRRYPYERIDGRVRGNLRQAAIDRFCKPDSDRFVFLLCTRAGGLGINLTAADTVIIFDSDWNPQNDLQAQARCHRIGQTREVKVYRLICRNTYEREMFDKASLKLGLDKAVLQSMNSQKENLGVNQQLSKKEIEDLLRKGAYGALMDDDNAGDKFCEEDIDQILERRTRVITLEGGTKGSTFAKATFSSSNNCTDIEIDDPNFWEKWAKRANLDMDDLKNKNELIVQEPRRRTQTRRFGADDNLLDLSDLESSDDDDEMSVSARTRAGRGRSGGRNHRKSGARNRKSIYDRERDEDLLEDIAPGNWTRAECFKVEKGLLTFGWGRWEECMALAHFRRSVTTKDVEDISRTVLLYCLQHYKGDEKIKGFIWDLITPNDDGEMKVYKNHSGLSAPVPRGRKGKKVKKDVRPSSNALDVWAEWAKEDLHNPDLLLNDENYKRHLHRHSNKVLLRVRLLYYLKHEVIGELHHQVIVGMPASEIPLPAPSADGDPPCAWWDEECDRSLLIGVHKHGYERYNIMRQDPALCFLVRCGPPDGAALLAEMRVIDDDFDEKQKDILDLEEPLSPSITDPATPQSSIDTPTPTPAPTPGPSVTTCPSSSGSNSAATCTTTATTSSSSGTANASACNLTSSPSASSEPGEMGKLLFPSVTDLNTRLRRIITGYQRTFKKQELKMAQKVRINVIQQRIERREKFEAAIREREIKKRELQQRIWWPLQTPPVENSSSYLNRRWSRREEADFYRTISSYGVEYDSSTDSYNWSRFRAIGRLDRKVDDTLTEYFKSFYAMCKRVCGRKLSEEEEHLPMIVEQISEERASRCLQKVELLSKIREEILFTPHLDERLKLCQPSMDLPDWWQCGKHDKDLLIGAAKYGLARLDYHLLHDPDLCFKDVLRANTSKTVCVEDKKPTADAIEKVKECIEDVIKESAEKAEAAEREASKHKEDKLEEEEADDAKENDAKQATEKEAVDEESVSKEELVSKELNELDEPTADSSETETKSDKEDKMVLSDATEIQEDIVMPQKKEDASTSTDPCLSIKEEHASGVEESQTDEAEALHADTEGREPTVAQLLAQTARLPIRWPKDKVLQIRLEHVCHAIEKNEWPVIRPTFLHGFPVLTTTNSSMSPSPHPSSPVPTTATCTPTTHSESTPPRATPEPQVTLATDVVCTVPSPVSSLIQPEGIKVPRRRRRRRRFEIEAERAKLRAILSHTMQQQLQQQFLPPPPPSTSLLRSSSLREEHPPNEDATSLPRSHSSAPPPAHQNSAPRMTTALGTLDLSVKSTPSSSASSKNAAGGVEIAFLPTSPMDLSSNSMPMASAPAQGSSQSQKSHGGSAGRGRGRMGGSRIDALALGLQARKQQEILEQQKHHPILDNEKFIHKKLYKEMKHDGGESTEDEIKIPKLKSHNESRSKNHDIGLKPSASSIVSQTAAIRQDLKRWLEEHPEVIATNPNLAAAAAMAFNPLPSVPLHTELLELPDSRRRGRRPRVDPTKLDYERITGEENVSVVNRLTGKKITGSKAPPLKHLSEWLEKNPMFDVDPKWAQLVKEKGNLPDSLHKRIVTPSDKRGRRTAASLLSSAHQNAMNSQPFSSASSSSVLNPLNFSNSGLLSGFPGMKLFMDPPKTGSTASTTSSTSTTNSTPPIFLPFGGLAGMGLTNPLFGFSGFSFPGLQGPLGGTVGLDTEIHRKEKHKDRGSSRNKSAASSSLLTSGTSTSTTTSASAGLNPASSLPFLYPTPSLLYNPLGLSGFGLPPNMPASFATLAQAGLMNGLGSLCSTATTTPTTSSSNISSLHMPMGLGSLTSLPRSKVSTIVPTTPSNLMDSDDESLKSLMENHDDDDLDDDLDTADSDDDLDFGSKSKVQTSSDQTKKESKLDRPTSAPEANPS